MTKRIGFWIDTNEVNQYLRATLETLEANNNLDLFILFTTKKHNPYRRYLTFSRTLLFSFLSLAERALIFSIKNQSFETDRHRSIDTIVPPSRLIEITDSPLNHQQTSRPCTTIKLVPDLRLDLIVSCGTVFDMEQLPPDGIISYSPNRYLNYLVSAFWPVHLQSPSTEFVIRMRQQTFSTAKIVQRCRIPTAKYFSENIDNLIKNQNSYITDLIERYCTHGRLPVPMNEKFQAEEANAVPTISAFAAYFAKTIVGSAFDKVSRTLLRKRQRWNVAYCYDSWVNADFKRGRVIENPKNGFFADPFVITKNDRTVCYVEDYCYLREKGSITAIEIETGGKYKILGTVIEEKFHLSFPYLFTYKDDLFMVPETSQTGSVRLYKCIKFPMNWRYEKDILCNISTSDTILFPHGQYWWLLTNPAFEGSDDHCTQLCAYYSENPTSDRWVEHKRNPLIVDSNISRNGGLLSCGKQLIRVRQKQGFCLYGASMTLATIDELTPDSFSETEFDSISADFFSNILGCHSLNSTDDIAVYDFLTIEKPY